MSLEEDEKIHHGSNNNIDALKMSLMRSGSSHIHSSVSDLEQDPNWKTKLYEFYKAPVTKFWMHSVGFTEKIFRLRI